MFIIFFLLSPHSKLYSIVCCNSEGPHCVSCHFIVTSGSSLFNWHVVEPWPCFQSLFFLFRLCDDTFLCWLHGLCSRRDGFVFMARWNLWHFYYFRLIFLYLVLLLFSSTLEKEVKASIGWDGERDNDTMKIGKKQMKCFAPPQLKFKIRLDNSHFSQKK